jgi:predicted RNA binding protein YcfA (HicA-like mRNA interferase family)
VSSWPAAKAKRVKEALFRIGWVKVRQRGTSHMILHHPDFGNYVWAFHDSEEIGPRMLARIGKKTGLTPEDL